MDFAESLGISAEGAGNNRDAQDRVATGTGPVATATEEAEAEAAPTVRAFAAGASSASGCKSGSAVVRGDSAGSDVTAVRRVA